jgi:hypothetical protein
MNSQWPVTPLVPAATPVPDNPVIPFAVTVNFFGSLQPPRLLTAMSVDDKISADRIM